MGICYFCAHYHEPGVRCDHTWYGSHPFAGDQCECEYGKEEPPPKEEEDEEKK